MADLKPIGSEKLTGQEKLNRIMEIARFKETSPSNINENSRSEYNIGLADGNSYEIVKERQGYIIKKIVAEGTTEYIEPMKNRKYFSSYSQAFKRLNLLAAEINRINENEEGVSLYGEQKKFVLKTPKAQEEPMAAPAAAPPTEPPPVPAPELPAPDMGETGSFPEDGEMAPEDADMAPEGDVEDVSVDSEVDIEKSDSEEAVTFKTIQKLTGKLTQKIRTLDNEQGMTSEDIKYVINMVLSSLDLGNLSEEDKEDIMSKFDEESEDLGADDMGGEDMTDDTEVEDIQADMDVSVEGDMENKMSGALIDSIFAESKVDKVISKYFEISKKEILESRKKVSIKRQMNEVQKLVESVEQKLAAKKFLEENQTAVIIGKTNKKNLVFENKGKQIKISPEGLVL